MACIMCQPIPAHSLNPLLSITINTMDIAIFRCRSCEIWICLSSCRDFEKCPSMVFWQLLWLSLNIAKKISHAFQGAMWKDKENKCINHDSLYLKQTLKIWEPTSAYKTFYLFVVHITINCFTANCRKSTSMETFSFPELFASS